MSRKRLILTAIVLVLVLAIGGILAYFTDVQTRHNKFKTGMVDVAVEEPSWPGQPIDNPDYDPETNPDVPQKIDPEVPVDPGQEIPKDPQVVNKGNGEVYAFVEVTIPVRNVKVGNATIAAPTQLFELRHITDATTTPKTTATGINDGWVQIKKEPQTLTAETTSVTYVFAYGTSSELEAIAAPTVDGETTTYARTTPVFDTVKFADVTETEYNENSQIQGQSFEVTVKGYGIQAEGLSSKVPSTVWTNDLKK